MLAISAGHYEKAKGAASGGFSEFPETLVWANDIAKFYTAKYGPCYLVPSGTLSHKIRNIKKLVSESKIKLALEIHFNSSASGKGKGSETLYYPGSIKGAAAAVTMQSMLASIFPPNRGIKEAWHRMDVPGQVDYPGDVDGDETINAFVSIPGVICLIIEPEFVQNGPVIKALSATACELIADACNTIINSL